MAHQRPAAGGDVDARMRRGLGLPGRSRRFAGGRIGAERAGHRLGRRPDGGTSPAASVRGRPRGGGPGGGPWPSCWAAAGDAASARASAAAASFTFIVMPEADGGRAPPLTRSVAVMPLGGVRAAWPAPSFGFICSSQHAILRSIFSQQQGFSALGGRGRGLGKSGGGKGDGERDRGKVHLHNASPPERLGRRHRDGDRLLARACNAGPFPAPRWVPRRRDEMERAGSPDRDRP